MTYERLVALNVIDDQRYEDYRQAMKPILLSYGGKFGYDFEVSKVLISETISPINRVFTINFPNIDANDKFFSDPDYIKVRTKHFEISVANTTIISSYEKT